MGKGFEEFQPIFGEAKGEWESTKASGQPSHQLLPFLFHVHALDHSQLRIHLTDFHSYSWECVRTVQHLEDLVGHKLNSSLSFPPSRKTFSHETPHSVAESVPFMRGLHNL